MSALGPCVGFYSSGLRRRSALCDGDRCVSLFARRRWGGNSGINNPAVRNSLLLHGEFHIEPECRFSRRMAVCDSGLGLL
jgi:hypothetical protein